MTKILMIEDDAAMRRLYKTAFTKKNYQIEEAADGEEGIRRVKEGKPDLILMDVMIPRKNGLEVLSELKADPTTKDIPVLALTNYSGDLDPSPAVEKGALMLIIKSNHEPQEIVGIVEKALENKS